jgi:hypothetical protein
MRRDPTTHGAGKLEGNSYKGKNPPCSPHPDESKTASQDTRDQIERNSKRPGGRVKILGVESVSQPIGYQGYDSPRVSRLVTGDSRLTEERCRVQILGVESVSQPIGYQGYDSPRVSRLATGDRLLTEERCRVKILKGKGSRARQGKLKPNSREVSPPVHPGVDPHQPIAGIPPPTEDSVVFVRRASNMASSSGNVQPISSLSVLKPEAYLVGDDRHLPKRSRDDSVNPMGLFGEKRTRTYEADDVSTRMASSTGDSPGFGASFGEPRCPDTKSSKVSRAEDENRRGERPQFPVDQGVPSRWSLKRFEHTPEGLEPPDVGEESNSKASGVGVKTRVNKSGWVDQILSTTASHDSALRKARQRNVLRLKMANEKDWDTLSKYLPSDASSFFPFGVEGPEDFHVVPGEWLKRVLRVAQTDCPVPSPPPVRFETCDEALEHNSLYLQQCGWNFEEVFKRNRGTTIDHGSEFRPIAQLEEVIGGHPNFGDLKAMFTYGFDYFLKRELTEEERLKEFEAQLERGNHKSATQNESEVQALLEGDVKHGFVLPVRVDCLHLVQGLHLQPGGMVRQLSLKADGSRKEKNRFTHDLSFSLTSEDASINSRIDMTKYVDMVYGWCFSRILHYLAALRFRHPTKRIFISKFDYSDAYKRISQSPKATASTVIRFGQKAYICWRMVFGGAPNPAGFSCFSETLTDLGNEIAMSSYEPTMGTSPTVEPIHSTIRETEEPAAPIGPAILPCLVVSTRVDSYRDCFIDDIIDCYLDTETNKSREGHIVQLAVRVMSRPHAGDLVEPVPRRPLLGPEKLEAEGRGAERQIVLGWEIRTRSFTVHLPFDKYTAWRGDLEEAVEQRGASQEATESLIGRLNHASYVIPLSRHFTNELRRKCLSVPRGKKQKVRFTAEELADLVLWLEFLDIAHQGMSINLLVMRTPTRIAWSDSCPFGIGGYTMIGHAWRIRVPHDCPFVGDDSVNNVLEFLGMAISVLLLLQEAREDEEEFPCLLVLGDNTSAIAWLFKSGRVPRSSRYYPAVKAIARHVAMAVTKAQAQLCSQHLAGVSNKISDLLSFEGTCRSKVEPLTSDCPPNNVLTSRIHKFHSQIIPLGFEIHQLPHEIESFAVSVMQIVARSWNPERSHPMSGGIDTGEGGVHSCRTPGCWEMTPSSIRYPTTAKDSSWQEGLCCTTEPSTLTDKVELLQSVRDPWYRRLFETPLAVWHRRSGNVEGPAPSTSRTESMTLDRSTPGSEQS